MNDASGRLDLLLPVGTSVIAQAETRTATGRMRPAGAVTVRVERHRDRLLAIRDGEMSWDALTAWRLELHKEFDDAFQKTTIPARPDYAQANAFLVRARRVMAEGAVRRGD